MHSFYLKCDGCGAILDRRPGWNNPLFLMTPSGGGEIREYSQSIGWIVVGNLEGPRGDVEDYCPDCAAKMRAAKDSCKD